MIEPFLKLVEKLVNDFSWKRLVVFILLIGFLVATGVTFELVTGYFRLSRLEKQITLLGKLREIQEKQSAPTRSLVEIQNGLTKQLEKVTRGSNGYHVHPRVLQGLAALVPWFLLSLGFLPDLRKDEDDASKSLLGILFFAIPSMAVCASISPKLAPILRYVIFPLIPATILMVVGLIGKWREAVKNREALHEHPLVIPAAVEVCSENDEKSVALRLKIREALEQAAKEGLRGDRHFVIRFATGFPGVGIARHLQDKYPGDMAIILQHKFWDLEAREAAFSVTLSFNDERERLTIPYKSISHFASPPDGLEFIFLSSAGATA